MHFWPKILYITYYAWYIFHHLLRCRKQVSYIHDDKLYHSTLCPGKHLPNGVITSLKSLKQSFVLDFSTYIQQLLTFVGLTESHYAVQVDAGPCLVTVLNKAKGLKVKSGDLGNAVACHRCPFSHWTAIGEPNHLETVIYKMSFVSSLMNEVIIMICASIPGEEVVLFSVCHVVSSGSTKTVIQQ